MMPSNWLNTYAYWLYLIVEQAPIKLTHVPELLVSPVPFHALRVCGAEPPGLGQARYGADSGYSIQLWPLIQSLLRA